MNKAGGILGIIAGVFSILSTIITFLVGSMAVAFKVETGSGVINVLLVQVLVSFLVIIFGAICIGTPKRIFGLFLIISSIFAIIFGGTIVALFMILALIGGILAIIGSGKKKQIDNI